MLVIVRGESDQVSESISWEKVNSKCLKNFARIYNLNGLFNHGCYSVVAAGGYGAKLPPQIQQKSIKKSMLKSIKKLIPSKIDFRSDFGGFWNENGSLVAPKSMKNQYKLRKANF